MHTTRALIQATPAAGLSVAGLPLLARTILSLWSTGVRVFTVIGASQDAIAATGREVRRAAPDVCLHWVGDVAADPESESPARVIFCATDGVFTAQALARVIARPRLANVQLRFAGADGADVWFLTATDCARRQAGHSIAYDRVQARSGDFAPVRDASDVEAAERRVFAWCIKPTDGIVSRLLNRPISTWFSRHLSHHDIRPRELTAVTALMALTTFACLLTGTLPGLIAGCVLYHFTSVADGFDGEIARAKYMSSRAGAALDTGVDMASNLLFMIGISVGSAEIFGESYLWLGVFIAATATTAIILMTMVLRFGPGGGSFDVLQLTIEQRLAPFPRTARAFAFVHSGFKRDLFAFMFALLGVAGVPNAIPWLLAFGTSMWLIAIMVNTPAMLRANRDDVLPSHLEPARAVAAAIKAQRQPAE